MATNAPNVPFLCPPVIGHRGAAGHAPENTLAGLTAAASLGVSWAAFDVQLSACGRAVLMHDDTLDRTTNGRGLVSRTDLELIQTLDAGSGAGPSFAGEPVPTLEEALTLATHLGLGLDIEIKPCAERTLVTVFTVARAVRRMWPDRLPPPLITSKDPVALAAMRQAAPELPRGLVLDELVPGWTELLLELECATLSCHESLVDETLVPMVREHAPSVAIIAFTVNDPDRAAALRSAGVGGVFSDVPDRVVASAMPRGRPEPPPHRPPLPRAG